MRLMIWRFAFDSLLQTASNIHQDGELVGAKLRLHKDDPLIFNACNEAREEMSHLLLKNQSEIRKRDVEDIGPPSYLEVSCFPRYFLVAQTLGPFPFFISSIIEEASTLDVLCFLPKAFSKLSKISFLPKTIESQGTSSEKAFLLRGLTYILQNLELFPSLVEIDVGTDLYPELLAVWMSLWSLSL